jgi:GT2 family glycosyltransferase
VDTERWRAAQLRSRQMVGNRRGASQPVGAAAVRAAKDHGAQAPLASVIVVCWNSAKVLGRCLEQLFAQDYPNYEIIVVDDGSQDETAKIAQRAASGGRLKLVHSAVNGGCPHARNLGLREARGEVIAFVDADGYAARDWLSAVVAAFGTEETIGGVASTVFFDANPMVLNGAGGTINRQGWAADLCMNQSYEHAQIPAEALYPMGCGMAFRRAAVERVGEFDDRMLNYYDDVDYGIRLWRAGYRVVVAADAWVDHGFGQAGGASPRKALLCERHRMRVVLKSASGDALASWVAHEARALWQASPSRRALKLRAAAWNMWRLPSVLAFRRRLRGAPQVPEALLDASWGDGFPAGMPSHLTPRPESASQRIDMADPGSEGQLLYGWFPVERSDGRSHRWATGRAAALISLDKPARRLRLDYAHVPVDNGGVDLHIRRVGTADPLVPVWSVPLVWQYSARSVENHPLELSPGDYEVLFSARKGWLEPPLRIRTLGMALSSMSFEDSFEIPSGGLDMASPSAEEQLVSGWYEAEGGPERSYRWAAAQAAVVVRLGQKASEVTVSYCLPPGLGGAVDVSIHPIDSRQAVSSVRIIGSGGDWREDSFQAGLEAGDYVVAFEAEAMWSNPGQQDPDLPPENRTLGFALSSLSFGYAA